MNNILVAAVLVVLLAVLGMLVWLTLELRRSAEARPAKKTVEELDKAYTDIAEEDVLHLFNTEFREELRNRGRLRFESVINENAMFLKHDLDLTIAQLNDHIKHDISKHLQEEFANYAKAMNDAQNLALDALRKTASEVDEQRVAFSAALKQEVQEREAAALKLFEDNMAQIVEHYVQGTLGDQFDLRSQLPYIIEQMEANKEAIIKDMKL